MGLSSHRCFRGALLPIFGVAICWLSPKSRGDVPPASAEKAKTVAVHVVSQMPNSRNPQILYWFITDDTCKEERYKADINHLASEGPFDLAFLTARTRVSFYDTEKMAPVFKGLVDAAHRKGLKVGLQLWPAEDNVPMDEQEALVVEGEVQLNNEGVGNYEATARHVRFAPPTVSKLLRVYAFKKTEDGEYKEGSVRDITSLCRTIRADERSVALEIHASQELAGYTAYVMTAHYNQYGDLFSDYHKRRFRGALAAYATAGFDGAALDEFKYMPVEIRDDQFRERVYSPSMAAFFRKRAGMELERTLFDMRYAPAGRPEIRIRAINYYFDTLRQGPLLVEEDFVRSAKELFGPRTFIGVHDTFHNNYSGDEVWHTGLNWWALPREYGQTDEDTPMPTRLGVALSAPKAVMYNMFYARDETAILGDAIVNARYNARTHYHAYNDDHGWGRNIGDPHLLAQINAVEHKIRLLNAFDSARPALDTLVVFGFPEHLNWFPFKNKRNAWDINGAACVDDKAQALWSAGYLCALAPSYEIDSGKIALDPDGQIRYGNHRFSALVYLNPEYSTQRVIEFLGRYTARGGKLMLDGTCSLDFDGKNAREAFVAIEKRATVRGFDVEGMRKLGATPNSLDDGCYYEDGSVVLADLKSAVSGIPKDFSVKLGSHVFSGRYAGVFALKVDNDGSIEKLAAGTFTVLRKDDVEVLTLSKASDIVVMRYPGGYDVTIIGDGSTRLLKGP